MSATPITVAATLRGRQAAKEVRDLLSRLDMIESDIDTHESDDIGRDFMLTHEEIGEVLKRRREGVVRQLENKGIRIAPDPEVIESPRVAVEVIPE